MATIWAFLSDSTNRAVLSWLGGGLVMVCGGFWTVVTFFRNPTPASTSGRIITNGLAGWSLVALVGTLAGALVLVAALSSPRVTASNGGVSVGGNVSGSSISTDQ